VMNADGTSNRQLTFTVDRHEHEPALSPDGRQLVFITSQSGLRSISKMNIDGGGVKELVRNVGMNSNPRVSPDSQWVFYNSRDETGSTAFWKVPFDGGQPVKVKEKGPCRLSPDGNLFVCSYRDAAPDAPVKLLVASATNGETVRMLDWPRGTNAVYWSPDGKAVDYVAERDGLWNIFRLTLDNGKEQKLTDWQTPTPLWHFAWSRDARQLAITRDTRIDKLVLIQNFR
jgi:Tol biopolymer transport system component